MQLHPGDLGWFWRSGAEATAAVVRAWSRDGRILAVGLLDETELLRLTIAPDARRDEELARQLVEDGWKTAEPWTPLRHDLAEPVGDPGVRIEVINAAAVATYRSAGFQQLPEIRDRYRDA